MTAFLRMIVAALFGNVAGGAAGGVAKVVEWGALLAALYPAWQWLQAGGANQVMFTLEVTYGLALAVAGAAWWSAKVIHRATPPAPPPASSWPPRV